MKLTPLLLTLAAACAVAAADAPIKPALKITPGQVIIPFDRMQRPWGELISLDLATRTGKFRRESTDEVVSFTVIPYAELLHHATLGDLQDFRVGERAIFRLHENEKGEWVWLTYIQDEMNMMNGHREYFYVDAIDAAHGKLTCTWGNLDYGLVRHTKDEPEAGKESPYSKAFLRMKDVVIETDKDTRFWKGGKPATFADIKVDDRLRTKTHGIGKGKSRVAWEVFLDDESLIKFQTEQKVVHAARIKAEGCPGYVDPSTPGELRLTLFAEGVDEWKPLKPGAAVRIAPAGVDRKPTASPIAATVKETKSAGKQLQITLFTTDTTDKFQPTGLVRLWPETK